MCSPRCTTQGHQVARSAPGDVHKSKGAGGRRADDGLSHQSQRHPSTQSPAGRSAGTLIVSTISSRNRSPTPQSEHWHGNVPVEQLDLSVPQPGPENLGPWYPAQASDSLQTGSKLAPVSAHAHGARGIGHLRLNDGQFNIHNIMIALLLYGVCSKEHLLKRTRWNRPE